MLSVFNGSIFAKSVEITEEYHGFYSSANL